MMGSLEQMKDVGAAVTPWAAIVLLVIALVRVWPALRKIKLEGDTSLRADLMERIGKLEAKSEGLEQQLQTERISCAEQMAAMQARHESNHASLEAQIQVLRHERNNETQSFDALLLLLETSPEKVAAIIPKIKEQRAQRAQAIAAEKAAIPILKSKDSQ